ncbi:MAG: hypothetical protein ACTSQ8_21090 [Candidatus Helarchaeota archaeon]
MKILYIILPSGIFVVIVLFLWAFNNLEQIEILMSWILRIVSWISHRTKLKAINTQIQAKINVAVENIEDEVEGVMPYPLKIEWVKGTLDNSTLKDNEIIVKLNNNFDDAQNLASATLLYLHEGFLRQSRYHTNPSLQNALDLEMAWKILCTNEESNLGHYFLENIYYPYILEDSKIEGFSSKIRSIDSAGMHTRIFLRELRGLGRKVAGELPAKQTKEETAICINFLNKITTSERGTKYPLDFIGRKIRFGILLVANQETLALNGIRPHKFWLKKKVRMGAESIYICAIGNKNVDLARNVAQWGQQDGCINMVKSQTFNVPSSSGKQKYPQI